MEEMGFWNDAKANDRWRRSEWDILKNICNAHGIEISEPKKSRGYSYKVKEYGEHQDKINALNAEIERLTAERDETVAEFEKLAKKKVNIGEIESIEAKESVFGKKVTLSKEDYDKWRYHYPEFDTTQTWAKVPSQALSDTLVEMFQDKLKPDK